MRNDSSDIQISDSKPEASHYSIARDAMIYGNNPKKIEIVIVSCYRCS